MQEKISRIMLETAIDKGLQEIKTKSKRGIRNLVDLGDHFAKGRFQKDFYNIAHKMLANENSPYYQLIFDTVKNVDHNILKTFGINIGYNSWTYGAEKIREYEKENSCCVPWTLIFDFRNSNDNTLHPSNISKIISDKKNIGLYSYIFFLNNRDDLKTLISLFKLNPECAFIIFVDPIALDEDCIKNIRTIGNVVISINLEEKNQTFYSQVELLKKNKLLFGIHSKYNDENAKIILNDSWIKYVIDLNCTFAFLIRSDKCNNENIQSITQYIKDAKINQKYPLFLIDFFEDISYVNNIISIK